MFDLMEYTGQLIGGPDDGNLVTSSVSEFPASETVKLWLDGEGKDCHTMEVKGVYVWLPEQRYFKWYKHSIKFGKTE